MTDSISRLLAALPFSDETRAIPAPEIRDTKDRKRSTIGVASMRDLGQLYCPLVYKSEEHSPVACDAERKKADERRGKMLGVQQWVVGVSPQMLNKHSELALLRFWQPACASAELRMKYYLKHRANLAVPREISSRFRNARWERGLPRGGPCARIQAGTHPRDLSRQCLWRASEAFALLLRGLRWSCHYNTPARQKINEELGHTLAGNETAALVGGGAEARVLPRNSWLQREIMTICANARRNGCQLATALGMEVQWKHSI